MAKSRKVALTSQIRKLENKKKKADMKRKKAAEIKSLEKKRDSLRKQVYK